MANLIENFDVKKLTLVIGEAHELEFEVFDLDELNIKFRGVTDTIWCSPEEQLGLGEIKRIHAFLGYAISECERLTKNGKPT